MRKIISILLVLNIFSGFLFSNNITLIVTTNNNGEVDPCG